MNIRLDGNTHHFGRHGSWAERNLHANIMACIATGRNPNHKRQSSTFWVQIRHFKKQLSSTLSIRRHSREPRSSAGRTHSRFLFGLVLGVTKQKASQSTTVVAPPRSCLRRSVVVCGTKPIAESGVAHADKSLRPTR